MPDYRLRPGARVWLWLCADARWAPDWWLVATITEGGTTTAMVAAAHTWPCRVPLWRIRTQAPEDLTAPPERPDG
jgi:hypothetical protein